MEQIINFVSEYLKHNDVRVEKNTPLKEQLSSLDIVEFACAVEEEYGILIPDEDINQFGSTIEQIVEYISEALCL